MSKRSNGEGTIYKRKDGRWCASKHVILADGVSKRKTVYGKTQKEVKEKLKQLEDEVFPAEAGKMLLQDWMLLWMKKYKKMQLKQTTYENYEMNINTHIKGTEIGTTRLIDLTTGALQEFYIGKLKGEHGDRKISCRTVEYLHTIIGSALTQAYKNGLILKNVNDSTVLPKKEQTEITPLTVEEVKKVLEVSKSSDIHALLVVAIYTGMRKGDDDDKIRLNQRKPSKYKGLRRFGPEKNLQRINKFMKERPIFYKNLIQMKENIRFYLRCFYCITKVMILQFNSENRTELARNG